MTEPKDPFATIATEIADEFESIAKKLPAVPADFSELRRLLALLPDPIPSETPSQGSGDPGAFSVGAATPNQSSSSLVGAAPGTVPGSAIGGTTVAPILALQVNLIDDGPLDSIGGASNLPTKRNYIVASSDFGAWWVPNTGVPPSFFLSSEQRLDPTNPFNSGQILIGAVPVAAADASAQVFGPGPLGRQLVAAHLASPFIVAQVRAFKPAGNVFTGVSVCTMTLELWREFNSGSGRETLLDSAAINVLTMNDSQQTLLKASAASSNFAAGEHVSLVVTLHVVATSGGSNFVAAFAEPAISLNTTADAPAFAPLLSHYRPIADDHMAYMWFIPV
jgi:hypothetical protein